MSGLVDGTGKPLPASDLKPVKLGSIELKPAETDPKKLLPNCIAWGIQSTPQGQQPAMAVGAFETSALIVFICARQEIDQSNERIEELEKQVEDLKQAMKTVLEVLEP